MRFTRVPVRGLVSLSGFIGPDDLDRYVTGTAGQPPVLLFSGENDIDYIAASAGGIAQFFASKNLLAGGGASTVQAEIEALLARVFA